MVGVADRMSQYQRKTFKFPKEENRVLREKLGHSNILLNDVMKAAWPMPQRWPTLAVIRLA